MPTELLRERYELLEVVGKGGEGELFRALDHLHGRQVALKARRVKDEASRALLLSEARVLLSLRAHPGLPLVREDFFEDDRYFIAMDWIDGIDLAAIDRAGRPGLDPSLVIGYLEQAADALEHLHTHDPPIVHGDVKPANLILTSSDRIVLVDFGLSSTPADHPRRAGTAGYVAPEVAAGARPTAAADIYSFAATALVLLTGEAPSGGAPSWSAIEDGRIPALERIVRTNMAVDPARRDASTAAVAARLRRWWGAELPRGILTLVRAEAREDSAGEVARERNGLCVAPADDGPQLLAFAAVDDGVGAARALAARFDARVGVVTGPAEPIAGSYRGETAAAAGRLLEIADRRQVLVDDATAEAIDSRLPEDVGLAKLPSAWTVVDPLLFTPSRAAVCPYRGLISFEPEDGDVFFGREEIVASILERLRDQRFLGVVGASGSGKSSLARAGVVPAWAGSVVVMTPGADPSAELECSLSPGTPSLLVVDQLEELFTLCPDEANAARFIDDLIDLWEAGSTSVVVTLRADFYGQCANHPRLAAALAEHQHLLGPMQRDELRRAIEGPARAAGLRFEPGLVESMLADVEGEPGALPLLSHALYESWVRRNGRVLTTAGYRATGGVHGAIAQTAEEVFLCCGAEEQARMRQLFLQLTELGDATEDTRRRVELAALASDGEATAAVLEELTASRLLVVADDSAEIAHEALIREWPRLRGWLAEDREQLRARRQLTAAARSWEEAGRDEADLYRGPRLAAAVELAGGERQLSHLEREFLDASLEAQNRELNSTRRRARRLRALLAVVATALVAAVIAGVFALIQRGNARHTATVAQAGRLAAQSRQVAAEHPDLGLLLALEAGRLDDSVDTRGALLGALEHGSRIRAWLQGFSAPVNASAFSPDGKLLATVTQNGTTLWNTATWQRTGPALRSSQGRGEGVDFSPDGRTLAVAGGKGRVELWEVATNEELRELTDPGAARADEPALSAVRYSPDGKVIAAGGQEANHVTLWNATSGKVIGRPITTNPPGSGAQSVSFSPDSKRIAVPGATGTVGIWDVATGHPVGKPLRIGSADVEEAFFTHDGRTLIASDDSGSVSTIDVARGRRMRPPLSVGDTVAGALALSPDGRLLAAVSYDGPVFVWDAKTGVRYGSPLTSDTSPPNDVVFSPDGRTLVSSHLHSAVVWNVDGEEAIGKPVGGPADLTTAVAFSPDGKTLVAGRFDGGTDVYDAATRRKTLRISGKSIVTAVAYRPHGDLIAVATIDGKVRFFDAKSGAAVGVPLGTGKSAVWAIRFSPDGRLLAVAVDPNGSGNGFYLQKRKGQVQLWDVDARRRVGRAIVPRAGSVLALAFSPDGTLLATGSYKGRGAGRLDLWDVADQTREGTSMKVTDDAVGSIAFDPEGRLVADGGAIGPVRVWRVADHRPAFPPLPGHTAPVTGVAFDPDGSFLATTSVLSATRLWDPETGFGYGDELVASPRPASLTSSIDLPFLGLGNAFSPDGKQLAVAGVETLTMLWDVDPAVWRRRACAIAGRNLTREQWKLYLPAGKPYRATCPEWPSG